MKQKKFVRCNIHLPVKSLQGTIKYYRDTLGFYDEWTWKNKEGMITDGGIRRDDMRLLFGEDPDFVQLLNSYQQNKLTLLWFVENIDEIYAEFKDRGIAIADDLRTHPYGLREFAFIDINGYCIRVAEAAKEQEGES